MTKYELSDAEYFLLPYIVSTIAEHPSMRVDLFKMIDQCLGNDIVTKVRGSLSNRPQLKGPAPTYYDPTESGTTFFKRADKRARFPKPTDTMRLNPETHLRQVYGSGK